MEYYGTTDGKVFNKYHQQIKGWDNGKGYLYFSMYDDEPENRRPMSIHRFIWIYFNKFIPEGFEVNHINGDKHDNRLCNLEVITPKENNRQREYVKLTYDKAQTIRAKYNTGLYTYRNLSNDYNVSVSQIRRVIKNIDWT